LIDINRHAKSTKETIMSEGTFRDLEREFPGAVILGAGRKKPDPDKIEEDHPAQPAEDPFGTDLADILHDDPDDGLRKPDEDPEPAGEGSEYPGDLFEDGEYIGPADPEPEDESPPVPPAPKSILELRPDHG
jgi:hypothetical protein